MMGMAELAVKTSLVLACGMLVAVALHRRSPALRHWILAAALICAALVPLVERLTPSWSLPASTTVTAAQGPVVAVTFDAAAPGTANARTPRASTPHPLLLRDVVGAVVVPLWLTGAAVNLFVLAFGMMRLRRLRLSSASLDGSTVRDSLGHVAAALGLGQRVAVLRSPRRAVIVTWGVVRPKIVLPADVDGWPRERLEVVLAHEAAHIIRGDWVVQTVAEVCKALYWFNPLFWLACARLRYESERACDDAVMAIGVTSHAYATELLELARCAGRPRQPWFPAPAMAARPSNLERRVRAMLNTGLDRGPLTRGARWASAIGVLLVTLPIATFAQGGFVTFSGTVVDQQDRLLPGATIAVADAQRGVTHETKTDGNGRFELVGLPAGDYGVEATLPGFRNLSDMLVISGQSVDRTLKMQVSQLQETVSVISESGAVTGARQTGPAFAKRPNPACAPGAANGVGGNIRPPHKVKDVRPGYPGVSGDVELVATIGTDGSVTDVQVAKADRPELGAAAIDAVRQWEFDSTLLNCVPIDVQMNVSISFRANP
jgi:TonB family protein